MVIYDKDKKILVIPVGVYGVESHGGGEGGCNLTTLTATSNGIYIPTEYDGYSKVEVNVKNSECPELEAEVERLEGENAELVNKNEELSGEIEEKNTEIERLEGEVTKAYNTGMADQKAKLESVTFTENGVYTKEDGYNMVTVDVPSGGCPELEREVEELTAELNNKVEELAEKESEVITLTEANTALNEVNNTLSEENTELTTENQTLTDENTRLREEVTTAYDDGIAYQKGKLSSKFIYQDGTYTNEDGWNSVEVIAGSYGLSRTLENIEGGLEDIGSMKYSAIYRLFGVGREINVPSGQYADFLEFNGAYTRVTDATYTINGAVLAFVYSNNSVSLNDIWAGGDDWVNYYNDNIQEGDYLPYCSRVNVYFNPQGCRISGLNGQEIKFFTKDKPNIKSIDSPTLTTLYFPSGTDLSDLRAQYPTATILDY